MSAPKKTLVGKNLDGTDRYNYSWANPDGSPIEGFLGHVLMTGPITGAVTLSDGSTYDVTETYIDCKPEHAGPLHHHIHRRLHLAGVVPTEHECHEGCGFEQGK